MAVEVLEAAGAAVEHRAALLRLILIWMGRALGMLSKTAKFIAKMVILSIYQHHKSWETRKIWDMA